MSDTTNIGRQFLNALKRGTGEAYLIVRDNPQIDFSAQIIKGVLNNFAYDGQSEGSRAQYISDLISISKQKDKIRKIVLQGLATEENDAWSLAHLFDLAKLYAQKGDTEARQAIYDRFLNNSIEGSDRMGYSEILELDGLEGMFFIAEKSGKRIAHNPDCWEDGSVINHFQDENKGLKVNEELDMASKNNKFIKIYLNKISKTENESKDRRRETTEFNGIVDEVINGRPFLSFRRRRDLNEQEVLEIATQILKEKDKLNFEKLLVIFSYHKFPYDGEFILDLAKGRKTSKNRVKESAIDALKHLKSDSIRQFAIENIENNRRPCDYLEILISNYSKGDHRILSHVATKYNDEHIIEHIAAAYTEIYKANPTKECKEPLEILYNKMNCGIHRKGIVELLIRNDVLSDKIRNEIRFDSYLQTRELLH